MLNLNYDKKFDVLYISIGDPKQSYGEENTPGLVILKDIITNEITGVTIFDFKKRLNENTLKDLDLPIKIDFSNEVNPFVS